MTFRPYQKVICVNADRAPQLILSGTYTVKQVLPVRRRRWQLTGVIEDMEALLIYEVEPDQGCEAFDIRRFRPAVERKTDISIFQRMLKNKVTHE